MLVGFGCVVFVCPAVKRSWGILLTLRTLSKMLPPSDGALSAAVDFAPNMLEVLPLPDVELELIAPKMGPVFGAVVVSVADSAGLLNPPKILLVLGVALAAAPPNMFVEKPVVLGASGSDGFDAFTEPNMLLLLACAVGGAVPNIDELPLELETGASAGLF